MLLNKGIIALVLVASVLTGCVAPPPRQRVVYHEGTPQQQYRDEARVYSDEPPPPPSSSYRDDRDDRYASRCYNCGTVRDVDQVQLRQGNSGGGAVLGAIIGGVIGNQFGRGSGRAAATAVGVVGGAAIGNAAEEDNARHYSGYAWRFHVELDDGRWATVTQRDNPGFHPGDRVIVRGEHLEYARR